MKRFLEFIPELFDKKDVALRVARRYGKKTYSDGSYIKRNPGEYVPVTKRASSKQIASAVTKLDKVKPEQKTSTFNISDLHATQHNVTVKVDNPKNADRLERKIAETDPKHIHIITHNGMHMIDDGHHAIAAARLRGEKTITAKHSDLDAYK